MSSSFVEPLVKIMLTSWKNIPSSARNFSSHEEKMRRFKQFKKTMDKVLSYGRRRGIGINKFADWLPSELANMACFTVPDQMERRKPHFEIQEPLPERFSWEDYGILTRVKDQLTCDSCWAMATAGIIESLHNYRDGTLTSCSVQQLVDCSREWGTHGCNASNPGDALNYVWNISSRLQGLSDWDYYPYDKRATEPCRYIPREGDRGIKYWSYTSAGAEVMQRLILRRGPIVGAVNASDDFMNFKGTGVFKDPDCPTTPTHALMIVGWGVAEDETPYWIVKNSWGESWGNAGFAKIERNVNMCGIEVWGYWVTI